MPDPIEQIFLQAQAPTGKSNTGYEAFAQGRQLGQRQQQLNIEERQQALREQMAPLEAHTQMLMNTERGLDIQLKLLAKQRDIQVQSAESEAVQLMLEAGKVGYTDPSIADKMFKLYDRVPALVGTQFGKSLLDNWRLAQAQKKAQSDLQNIPQNVSGLPLKEATIDERTGQVIPKYQRIEPSTHMKEVDAYMEALDEGDNDRAEMLKKELLKRGVTPGTLEKDVTFLKTLKDEGWTPDEINQAIQIRTGRQAKAGVEHKLTESQYIEKHLERYISEHGLTAAKRPEAIEVLRREYRSVFGAGANTIMPSGIKTYNPKTGKLE